MIIKNSNKDNCVIRLFNMLHCINIRILIVVFVHKTSLTSPLFIEVPVPNQESNRTVMYVCLRGINLASVSTSFLSDFGTLPTVVFLFVFVFVLFVCFVFTYCFLIVFFSHFIYNR